MNKTNSTFAQELALVGSRCQAQQTGRLPTAVTVVFSDDTLVLTLHDSLTPAEKALAKTPTGAVQVQAFYRELLANFTDEIRREIEGITGRKVQEAAAEIETATGTVVHAFTTGAMVQVFLMVPGALLDTAADSIDRVERAEDDGLRVDPEAISRGVPMASRPE